MVKYELGMSRQNLMNFRSTRMVSLYLWKGQGTIHFHMEHYDQSVIHLRIMTIHDPFENHVQLLIHLRIMTGRWFIWESRLITDLFENHDQSLIRLRIMTSHCSVWETCPVIDPFESQDQSLIHLRTDTFLLMVVYITNVHVVFKKCVILILPMVYAHINACSI